MERKLMVTFVRLGRIYQTERSTMSEASRCVVYITQLVFIAR